MSREDEFYQPKSPRDKSEIKPMFNLLTVETVTQTPSNAPCDIDLNICVIDERTSVPITIDARQIKYTVPIEYHHDELNVHMPCSIPKRDYLPDFNKDTILDTNNDPPKTFIILLDGNVLFLRDEANSVKFLKRNVLSNIYVAPPIPEKELVH